MIPKTCPKCNSNKVLKILYGLPTDEAMSDPEIYLGGCCVFGNDPKYVARTVLAKQKSFRKLLTKQVLM